MERARFRAAFHIARALLPEIFLLEAESARRQMEEKLVLLLIMEFLLQMVLKEVVLLQPAILSERFRPSGIRREIFSI